MPRKNFKTKDPFEPLDREYRDAIEAMTVDEIRDRIASVSLDQVELIEARDADEDYRRAKEEARDAGAIYRDGTKLNRLRIEFAKQVLSSRGKV